MLTKSEKYEKERNLWSIQYVDRL